MPPKFDPNEIVNRKKNLARRMTEAGLDEDPVSGLENEPKVAAPVKFSKDPNIDPRMTVESQKKLAEMLRKRDATR